MRDLLWLLAALGSLVGGFFFINGLVSAESAPQEAAAAAAGVAFGVLPYICARAFDELRKS